MDSDARSARPPGATGTTREALTPYLRSVLLLSVPSLVSIIFHPYLKTHPAYAPVISVAYLIAMCSAAWSAGYIAGIVAVFICLEASIYAATGHFSLRRLPPIGTAAITLIVLLVSWIAGSRRRVEQLLRSSNEKLEAKVRERTAELERARDWLQTTLVSIGDAVIATDPEGTVILMNPTAESLTGWTQAEAAGRPLTDVFRIVNEESRQAVENPVSKVLASGAIVGLANHTVLLARDGREIAIDDSAAPICDSQGQITGVVLTFRDIAEKRSLEAERERLLREASSARAQLYSVLQQTPAMINLGVGPDHVFEVVHPMTQELMGVRDITGLPFREALPDLAEQGMLEILDEVYRSGAARSLPEHPLRVTLPDGTVRELCISILFQPWHDLEGNVAGVITAGIDVTEQVRVRREMAMSEERLREAARLESLGVMAGGIAHDFNNLLVGIMGNASLALEMVPGSGPEVGLIQDLLRASEKAALLTRQMLAYSGKGNFVIEPVDLGELVYEILPLISGSIPPNVSLSTSLSGELPPIEGDRAQLQQVVMNLVINAAEACGADPGSVVVNTAVFERSGALADSGPGLEPPAPSTGVLLSVTDTGCGMPDEVKSRIFDPFFTTKFTGRGLGLSAVQGIIRAHKGDMEIDTAPGKGTTFTVFFPAAADHVPTTVRTESRPGDLSGQGVVMVVDDEDIVRKVVQLTLQKYGYRVLAAATGADALEMLRQRRKEIGLVLLDLTMPGLTGDVVFREMRLIEPGIRVILSSGFNESDAMERFGGCGLSGFLQKPFTVATLAEKIKAVLHVDLSVPGRSS